MIGIETHHRTLSTYICGNPGSGKSSLIQRMVLEDIVQGEGVCVIDPTGDLINTLLQYLPERRLGDVIYFDTSMPVAIDFFSYRKLPDGRWDESERKNLIDDLVSIFELDNAPRAKPLLYKIISTLFDANENPRIVRDGEQCTFLDINHFCQSDGRRKKILSYCSDERNESWAKIPNAFDFEPITYRMIPFLESKTLRQIIGCREPKLSLWDVMQGRKILFVSLEDTPSDLFIGSLLVSKIQQAAFRRRDIAEARRTPFYLYIDECQTVLKFAVENFEKILTRARKYKLCLILANPLPSDLPDKVQSKLGTIGNLVLFNLDDNDARIFKTRVAPYLFTDLVNLPKFHALFRTDNRVSRVKTPYFLEPRESPHAESIKKRTLSEFACNTVQKPHIYRDGPKPDDIQPQDRPHLAPDVRKMKRGPKGR